MARCHASTWPGDPRWSPRTSQTTQVDPFSAPPLFHLAPPSPSPGHSCHLSGLSAPLRPLSHSLQCFCKTQTKDAHPGLAPAPAPNLKAIPRPHGDASKLLPLASWPHVICPNCLRFPFSPSRKLVQPRGLHTCHPLHPTPLLPRRQMAAASCCSDTTTDVAYSQETGDTGGLSGGRPQVWKRGGSRQGGALLTTGRRASPACRTTCASTYDVMNVHGSVPLERTFSEAAFLIGFFLRCFHFP